MKVNGLGAAATSFGSKEETMLRCGSGASEGGDNFASS